MSQSQAHLPERCKQCGYFPDLAGAKVLPPRCKRCRNLGGFTEALLLLAMQDPPATAQPAESVRKPDCPLTPRQFQVLQLLSQSHIAKQIAWDLHIKESTVNSHIQAIFERLGVRSAKDAVATALRRGIIQ